MRASIARPIRRSVSTTTTPSHVRRYFLFVTLTLLFFTYFGFFCLSLMPNVSARASPSEAVAVCCRAFSALGLGGGGGVVDFRSGLSPVLPGACKSSMHGGPHVHAREPSWPLTPLSRPPQVIFAIMTSSILGS